jgi:methanogenic corrinoid protein MtbC1
LARGFEREIDLVSEAAKVLQGGSMSNGRHHRSELELSRRDTNAARAFASVSPPDPQETRARLSQVIASQIIPALLATSRPHAPPRVRPTLRTIDMPDIAEFTEFLLDDNEAALHATLTYWRAKGIPVETIYLELLTGAARRLGTLWGSDDCDFSEVSLASWRIQHLMYEMRPAFYAEAMSTLPSGFRVLLAPLALEQHSLGVMMAAEFFRRDGWEVSAELPADCGELVASVAAEHIDLAGISVSGDIILRELPAAIRAMRRASKNPRLIIMVGGGIFAGHPGRAEAAGADFAAGDAREALDRARAFVGRNRTPTPLAPVAASHDQLP